MSAHLFRAGFTSDPVEASVVVLVVAFPLVADGAAEVVVAGVVVVIGVVAGGFSAVAVFPFAAVGVVRLVVFFGDSVVELVGR